MTAAARKLEPDPEPPSLRAVGSDADGAPLGGARPNPLGPVLALGRRQVRVGIAVGLAGALFVHGAAAGKGLSTLVQLARFSAIVERAVVERLRASYDVDFTPPPEADVPEPEPEPPPDKTPQPAVQAAQPAEQRKSDNPYDEPPPAAAEAGKVLTAEPDPSEPVDMTDQGFISGSGDRFAGGTTAADGTAKSAVRTQTAKGGVAPGGTGTGKASAPPPPAQDLSKAPTLLGGGSWNDCGFPAEAEMDQVDFGIVTLTVTVGADGKAQSVAILSDPGHGFGRHARGCAMRKRFNPGLDKAGNPTTRTTPPIRVRFTR